MGANTNPTKKKIQIQRRSRKWRNECISGISNGKSLIQLFNLSQIQGGKNQPSSEQKLKENLFCQKVKRTFFFYFSFAIRGCFLFFSFFWNETGLDITSKERELFFFFLITFLFLQIWHLHSLMLQILSLAGDHRGNSWTQQKKHEIKRKENDEWPEKEEQNQITILAWFVWKDNLWPRRKKENKNGTTNVNIFKS